MVKYKSFMNKLVSKPNYLGLSTILYALAILTVSCQVPSSSSSQSSILKASFTYTPASPAAGQAVQFTDTSTGSPTSWQWNFGDGSTSTVQNPSHTFATAAAYTVTLTIWSGSASANTNRTINVGSGDAYWVSPTGTATYANAYSATELTGTACCSLDTANANARAGDMVYLTGGTYTRTGVGGIAPVNSGTSANNRITFSAAPGETPVLVSGSVGSDYTALYLPGNSYVLITGITFVDFYRFAMIYNAAHHVEVSYCDFHGTTGENIGVGFWMTEMALGGATFTSYVHDLWIHNNTFHTAHEGTPDQACVEGDDVVRVGYPTGTGGTELLNHNITVENNVIYHGGHVLFDKYSQYDVIKNNVFHNEPWIIDYGKGTCTWLATYDPGYTQYNGYYGHRCHQITRGPSPVDPNAWTLVEGNRYAYGSVNPNNDGADCLDLAASSIIVRFNCICQAMNNAIFAKYTYSCNNAVFNNTVYYNGFGYTWKYTSSSCPNNVCPDDMAGLSFGEGTNNTGYAIKNNIFYHNESYYVHGADIIRRMGAAPTSANGVIENNWLSSMADPQFNNPDLSNPMDLASLPDLSLQSTSPCIGAGSNLAVAVGAGSASTTLVVDNVMYFQDGTWGADMTHGMTLFPDVIAIGAVSNTVTISSINYSTNTITLASPMTWANGAPIWLYQDSSGSRVLYGAAPDLGAHPVVR